MITGKMRTASATKVLKKKQKNVKMSQNQLHSILINTNIYCRIYLKYYKIHTLEKVLFGREMNDVVAKEN